MIPHPPVVWKRILFQNILQTASDITGVHDLPMVDLNTVIGFNFVMPNRKNIDEKVKVIDWDKDYRVSKWCKTENDLQQSNSSLQQKSGIFFYRYFESQKSRYWMTHQSIMGCWWQTMGIIEIDEGSWSYHPCQIWVHPRSGGNEGGRNGSNAIPKIAQSVNLFTLVS